MMQTRIKHLVTRDDTSRAFADHPRLVVAAGRWGPMCIPVYKAMEELEDEDRYAGVAFRVVEFDLPAAIPIREARACGSFRGLPFVLYVRDGEIAHATSSIQTKDQIAALIDRHLG
ncbi:MAG: thioredoxin [Deltaproteobacteria bacterium]|nr:thioredoxin [Deltaproteobacteria bacterium]